MITISKLNSSGLFAGKWLRRPGWVKASSICDVVLRPVASSCRRRRVAVRASIVVSSLSLNVKGSAALRLGGV